MKKLLTILLVLMMVSATACSSIPEDLISNSQGDNSTSEIVTPDNSDEEQGEDVTPDSSDEEQGENETGSGNVVPPITGGGDFNAGNNY